MSSDNSQINFVLSTPFGDNVLSVESFKGMEEISSGFSYILELSSFISDLAFENIIGQAVSLTITQPHATGSQINGIATQFCQISSASDLSHYQLTIEPWMSKLHYRNNCRIFQEKTVLEIVKNVFKDAGYGSAFVDETTGSYLPRTYTVQYRESDYAFVHRLLAEVGIFYYYNFEEDEHTLVLSDDPQILPAIPGEILPYLLAHRESHREEGIKVIEAKQQLRPTTVSFRDFNFQRPSANSEVRAENGTELEIYDYPGNYEDKDTGESLAKVRLKAIQHDGTLFLGKTNSRRLACGHTFEMVEHLHDNLNDNYLLLKVMRYGDQHSDEATYESHFEAIKAEVPFSPNCRIPKPSVQGIQTAIVVGPSGEELWLDSYGRVKVQFHWDREGQYNDNSSCWIRVAQGMAGKNWGTAFHPRVGQEVIVQFIEGDLDRPIVSGSLYNEEHMPPYELPASGSQSVIKTRSTAEGSTENFNEIRIEDKKDKEHILIHAEKDFLLEVENNETHTVGNNRSVTVETDELLTVKNNRTSVVEVDESHTVKGNRNHAVEGDETVQITGSRADTVDTDLNLTVGGNETNKITGNSESAIDGELIVTTGTAGTVDAGTELTLSAGTALTIEAGTELTLKCGGASIKLTAAGMVEISGLEVTVAGTVGTTVESSAMTTISAPLVKIN